MLPPSTLTPVSSLAVCSACNYLPTSVMWHPQKSDIFVLGKNLDSHQANQGHYFHRTVFAGNFIPPLYQVMKVEQLHWWTQRILTLPSALPCTPEASRALLSLHTGTE